MLSKKNIFALVNGQTDISIELVDRGLHYGDGLFETMRMVNGAIPLWLWHWRRLEHSAARLNLQLPSLDIFENELKTISQQIAQSGFSEASIKLILTRVANARGYAPLSTASNRILIAYPFRREDQAKFDSFKLTWSKLCLSQQPALAGMKTLNRLESVLARGEILNSEFDEVLMCDRDGHVICATSHNLFLVCNNQLITPALDQNGVAGVMRQWLMDQIASPENEIDNLLPRQTTMVRAILATEVLAADEIFLSNALNGVVSVASINQKQFAHGAVSLALKNMVQRKLGW